MQNLANKTKFHEPEMIPFNSIVEGRYAEMIKFLGSLVKGDAKNESKFIDISIAKLIAETGHLSKVISTLYAKMKEVYEEENGNKKEIEELKIVIAQMNNDKRFSQRP